MALLTTSTVTPGITTDEYLTGFNEFAGTIEAVDLFGVCVVGGGGCSVQYSCLTRLES